MKKLLLPISLTFLLCSCGGGTPSSSPVISTSEESASPSLPSSTEELTSPSLSSSSEESSTSGEKTPLECYDALLSAATNMEQEGSYHYTRTERGNAGGSESSTYATGAIDAKNKRGFHDYGNDIALFDGGAPDCPITYRYFNNVASARYTGQDALESFSLNDFFHHLTPVDLEHVDSLKTALDVSLKFDIISIGEDVFLSYEDCLCNISSNIVTGELDGRYGFRYTASLALFDHQDDNRYLTATLVSEVQYEPDFIYLYKNSFDLAISVDAGQKQSISQHVTYEIEKGFNQTHFEQLKADHFSSVTPENKTKLIFASSGPLLSSFILSEEYFGKSVPVADLLSLINESSEGKFTATKLYEDPGFTKPITEAWDTRQHEIGDFYFEFEVNDGYSYIEVWHDSGESYRNLFNDDELAYIDLTNIDLEIEGFCDYQFVVSGEPFQLESNTELTINGEPYDSATFTPESKGKYILHYAAIDNGIL